jgi:hypothetical protein
VILAAASAGWSPQLDAPSLTLETAGENKIAMRVAAGQTGAPFGFTLWWMKNSDFDANGGWDLAGVHARFEAHFHGEPTLNLFPGQPASFRLGSGESITIECGDLFDETGVTHDSDALEEGTEYVFVAFANGGAGWVRSGFSANLFATTEQGSCTQGFWKTHGPEPCVQGNNSDEWPTNSLMLGNVVYTAAELCSIFQQPAMGNGLVSLAHQLIAAKFNLLIGAESSCILATIAAADALIGDLVVPPVGGGSLEPSETSALTQTLDDYNNGLLCAPHGPCPPVSVENRSWGSVKSRFR